MVPFMVPQAERLSDGKIPARFFPGNRRLAGRRQGGDLMAPFRWEKLVLWLLLAAGLAVGVGQVAAWVGGYVRPVGVFSLLVGGLLGGMLVGVIRLVDLAHRPTVLVGVVLAGLLCAASEHWGCYLHARREYARQAAEWEVKIQGLAALSGQLAQAVQKQLPQPPGSLREYLAGQLERGRQIGPWVLRGSGVWISWLAEAGLALAAAAVLVWATLRWPYCTGCESWYRTIRQGRLLPNDLARWAEVFEIPIRLPEAAGRFRAQFRLLQCVGQCTPGRIELVWETADGHLQTWQSQLDTAQRQKLDALWQSGLVEEEVSATTPPSGSAQERIAE